MASEKSPESKLAAALLACQEKFPQVKKGRTAQVGDKYSYTYADLSDILSAVGPVLRANGLALTQRYSVQEGLILLETMLLHVSGEILSSVLPISGPGPTAQELGSLMTYMRRYGLTALLGIATEDDDDGAAGNDATPVKKEPAKPDKSRAVATEAQRRMIWARAKGKADSLGWHDDTMEAALKRILGDLGIASSKELPGHLVDRVLDGIHAWTEEPPPPEGEF